MSSHPSKAVADAAIVVTLTLGLITSVQGQEKQSYTNEYPPFEVTFSGAWSILDPPNGPDLYLEYQPMESANLIVAAAPLGIDRSILLEQISNDPEALINQMKQQYRSFQLDEAARIDINNLPGFEFTATATVVHSSGSENIDLTSTILLGNQYLYFVTFQGTPGAYEHSRESARELVQSFSVTD